MGKVKRKRLKKKDPRNPDAATRRKMSEGAKRAYKETNGRGRIQQVLDGYKANGLKPKVNAIGVPRQPPLFVLQPSLEKKIVKLIAKGHNYTTVCRAVGVARKTFLDWLEKGALGYSEDHVRFYNRVQKADAKAEATILAELRMHSRSDWRVSAWQLERRWPEHWAKVDRVRAEMRIDAKVKTENKDQLGEGVIHDAAIRELARKVIDSANYENVRKHAEDAELVDEESE